MNKNKLYYGLLLLFFIIFVLIVQKGLHIAQPGDENVYYYMGKLVAEGKTPYKDFFFAHPPLQIYAISIVYKIFGFNIFALKLIPLISTLITAFFIFKLVKEKFGNDEAVISVLLYLFSFGVMFNSVFSLGVVLATMFLVAGIYFFYSNAYHLAGVFLGLSAITRLLSLIPIAVIFAIVLLSQKRRFLKLSLPFFVVFFGINILFIVMYGSDFTAPVYQYHLLKISEGTKNFSEYAAVVKLNILLFLTPFLAYFFRKKKKIQVMVFVSLAYLAFLLSLKKVFAFYFIIIFPFLAILGGVGISSLRDSRLKKYFIVISAIIIIIFGWNLVSDIIFLQNVGFEGFSRGEDIKDYLLSVTDEDSKIFGEDSFTPLTSLMTGIPIANYFIDTNEQVFRSGLRDIDKTLNGLDEGTLFLLRGSHGIAEFESVRNFLNNECEFLSQFNDKTEGSYLVYRC